MNVLLELTIDDKLFTDNLLELSLVWESCNQHLLQSFIIRVFDVSDRGSRNVGREKQSTLHDRSHLPRGYLSRGTSISPPILLLTFLSTAAYHVHDVVHRSPVASF